jgi:hypothetical protein
MDTKRLWELAEAATPGEWRYDYDFGELVSQNDCVFATFQDHPDATDTAFIAAANPATILALLDRLEAAETQLRHAMMAADAEARRVDELTAMLRAAEQDAARYRYIRDNMCSRSEPPYLLTEWEDLSGLDSEIDKRIDAARREG